MNKNRQAFVTMAITKHLAIRCVTQAAGHPKLSTQDELQMPEYYEAVVDLLQQAIKEVKKFKK